MATLNTSPSRRVVRRYSTPSEWTLRATSSLRLLCAVRAVGSKPQSSLSNSACAAPECTSTDDTEQPHWAGRS